MIKIKFCLFIAKIQNGLMSQYSLVGGKVENNESASHALAREVFEKVGVIVDPYKAEFAHVMHFMGQSEPCIALFFLIKSWTGTLINKEADKHSKLEWFYIDQLPESLIPRHRKAIELTSKHIFYSEDNW